MMTSTFHNLPVDVFSTCPPSSQSTRDGYVLGLTDVARWSDRSGCKGILVYADNSLLDPWMVSQVIIQNTESLSPLVAVQPAYMHPYSVAKMVATLGDLYRRRVHLNMVAGGFKNDLKALGDHTHHDLRYERLVEYTTIIKRLLADSKGVTLEGRFYRVEQLRLTPTLPQDLAPGIFLSGSSEAGKEAAGRLEATAVRYPAPPDEDGETRLDPSLRHGLRVGIIAREDPEAAWAIARRRFPEDRKGQIAHQLAMRTSDSAWHRQLSGLAEEGREQGSEGPGARRSPYWLVPFKNYKTFCPYLVGSHEEVAAEMKRYMAQGCSAVILDVPAQREDLEHAATVLAAATAPSKAGSPVPP